MERKEFIKSAAFISLASAMPKFAMAKPNSLDKLKIAIVGCGGRASGVGGTVTNMIDACQDIEIIAMGDLDMTNINNCESKAIEYIKKKYPDKEKDIWKVTQDTKFIGLDAIDKVLQTDCDIVALVTPPVFRTLHIEKCLNANKNIFAEKPICIDAWGLNKVYSELIPLANAKKLSVMCGTQMRHHSELIEAMDRIHSGQIGEIKSVNCLRYEGTYLDGSAMNCPKHLVADDIEYQIRRWIGFIWASGDQFVEQYIHNLDLAVWAINKMPLEVIGSGGRNADIIYPQMGDRFSHFAASYEFPDGISLTAGCRQEFNTSPYSCLKVYGTKGTADLTFDIQKITGENPWVSGHAKVQPLVQEHRDLMNAIRQSKHINTMKEQADSCYIAMCGREAAYSAKRLKCEYILKKSKQKFLPDSFALGDKKALRPIPLPANYQLGA